MIFTLEGNIGAGKSSLLAKLENLKFNKEHIVVFEPVDEWMQAKATPTGPSIFEQYYADKKRYGFMFQMYALQSRMQHMLNVIVENPNKIIICERCHLTDNEVFAQMLKDDGTISFEEYFVYKSWYDFMMSVVHPQIAGVLYLQVSPETCVNRIMKRDRNGEQNIQISYIKQLHAQHENWLTFKTNNYPVHVIDGSGSPDSINLDSIKEFIDHNTGSSGTGR